MKKFLLSFLLLAGGARAEKPDGFLDYIGSTGVGQYIKTGYVFAGTNGAPRVTATATIFNNDGDIAGTQTAAAGCFIINYDAQSYDAIYYRYGNSNGNSNWFLQEMTTAIGPYKNVMMDYDWGPSVYHQTADGMKLVGTTASYDFSKNTQEFLLFRGRTAPKVRFREVKMYDGDLLVRHYRAAVKDDVGCLYEVLSDTLVYNAGPGAFEKGDPLQADVVVAGDPAAYGTATPAYGASKANLNEDVTFRLDGALVFEDGVTAYPSTVGSMRAFLKGAVAQTADGPAVTNVAADFVQNVGDSRCTVTWRFTNEQARVAFSTRGGGTVSVAGGSAVASGSFWGTVGGTVRLAAVADEGWTFSRWAGDVGSANVRSPEIDLSVSVPGVVKAVFVRPGSTVGRYVQKDLIANWDAIDNVGTGVHEAEVTNEWTDVVGFRSFALSNVTVSAQAMAFGAASSVGILSSNDTEAVFGGAAPKTLEIMTRMPAGECRIALMTPAAYGVAFGNAYNFINVTSGPLWNRIVIDDFAKTNTYAVVYTNGAVKACFVNGEPAVMSDSTDNWSSKEGEGRGSVGQRLSATSYPLRGEIFAVRFYGRELTSGELAHNAKWDGVRYRGEKLPALLILIR